VNILLRGALLLWEPVLVLKGLQEEALNNLPKLTHAIEQTAD
jgi:hypothetical protein